MQIIYSAEAGATSSGREGKITSEDHHLELDLSVPKKLGGKGGEGTNPEQLFAAGYAACFSSAVSLIARQQKLNSGDFTIIGRVGLGRSDEGKYGLAVELEGRFPDLSEAQSLEVMRAAHEVCPYSNAIRGNVEVKLSVAS